jgi:hypothetical protein
MTERSLTQDEIERADAAYRQMLLSFLTLGLIPMRDGHYQRGVGGP